MIAFGTGGTEGASFEGLKELFYKPKSYNVLSFPNIWDEGRENTECAFCILSAFIPYIRETKNIVRLRFVEQLFQSFETSTFCTTGTEGYH